MSKITATDNGYNRHLNQVNKSYRSVIGDARLHKKLSSDDIERFTIWSECWNDVLKKDGNVMPLMSDFCEIFLRSKSAKGTRVPDLDHRQGCESMLNGQSS